MIPRVVGIDLSLTATGIARADGAFLLCPREHGMARLAWVRENLLMKINDSDLIVIEGYSFASKGNSTVDIGELGGVVRLALWENLIRYVDVAPSLVKKFATGTGNAKKDAVLVGAVRAGYEGADNNEADAWWLRQMGLYHLGVPEVPITLYRTAAVKAVQWPLLADEQPAKPAPCLAARMGGPNHPPYLCDLPTGHKGEHNAGEWIWAS